VKNSGRKEINLVNKKVEGDSKNEVFKKFLSKKWKIKRKKI
jgi:hypothetical protein